MGNTGITEILIGGLWGHSNFNLGQWVLFQGRLGYVWVGVVSFWLGVGQFESLWMYFWVGLSQFESVWVSLGQF